jgi:hypothetical protein
MRDHLSEKRICEAVVKLRQARDAGHIESQVVETLEKIIYWYGPPYSHPPTKTLAETVADAWAAWWEHADAAVEERERGAVQLELPGVLRDLDE